MQNFLPVMGLATLGSVLGLVGGIIMLSNKRLSKVLSVHSIPFAAGVMIAVSLLDVLPEAIEASNVEYALSIVLVVMIAAFFFEQFFMHIHHHHEHERTVVKSTMPLVVVGDTIHNFLDGLAIAASYLVDPSLGVIVAIATFLHEVPHEIGDFGLMIAAGWARKKIILVNLISTFSTYAGAFLVLLFAQAFEAHLGALLAVAGGLFLYIGASDLLPEVHNEERDDPWHQAGLLLFGVLIIWFVLQIVPQH